MKPGRTASAAGVAAKAVGCVRRQDLLALLAGLDQQIGKLDQVVLEAAQNDPQARLLMTQPGVGPNTALAFVLTIGDVSRLRRGKQVGSYLGLIPQEESFGSPAARAVGGSGPDRSAIRSPVSQAVLAPKLRNPSFFHAGKHGVGNTVAGNSPNSDHDLSVSCTAWDGNLDRGGTPTRDGCRDRAIKCHNARTLGGTEVRTCNGHDRTTGM